MYIRMCFPSSPSSVCTSALIAKSGGVSGGREGGREGGRGGREGALHFPRWIFNSPRLKSSPGYNTCTCKSVSLSCISNWIESLCIAFCIEFCIQLVFNMFTLQTTKKPQRQTITSLTSSVHVMIITLSGSKQVEPALEVDWDWTGLNPLWPRALWVWMVHAYSAGGMNTYWVSSMNVNRPLTTACAC